MTQYNPAALRSKASTAQLEALAQDPAVNPAQQTYIPSSEDLKKRWKRPVILVAIAVFVTANRHAVINHPLYYDFWPVAVAFWIAAAAYVVVNNILAVYGNQNAWQDAFKLAVFAQQNSFRYDQDQKSLPYSEGRRFEGGSNFKGNHVLSTPTFTVGNFSWDIPVRRHEKRTSQAEILTTNIPALTGPATVNSVQKGRIRTAFRPDTKDVGSRISLSEKWDALYELHGNPADQQALHQLLTDEVLTKMHQPRPFDAELTGNLIRVYRFGRKFTPTEKDIDLMFSLAAALNEEKN